MSKFDLQESVAWLRDSPLYAELPKRLAVAWSGGADSTLLLLTLQAAGFDVQAWHVDHAWHDASADDAALLQVRANDWGIPMQVQRLEKASPAKNREAHARAGRYAAFLQMMQTEKRMFLCLAHHKNDQAETVCMRMLQCAGVLGCQGMAAQREYQGLHLLRPWLHVSRGDIERVLHDADIPYLHDASNDDVSLWRNHIRHEFFPAMRQTGVCPEELFLRWQAQAGRVSKQLLHLVQNVPLEMRDGACVVEWKQWAALSAPVRAYVLQRMMQNVFANAAVVPGRRHILDVEAWTQRGGLGGLDLSGCRLQRRRKEILLLKNKGPLEPLAKVCTGSRGNEKILLSFRA